MSAYKGAEVERALLRKGFERDDKSSHHTYFRFRPGGIPTSVSTYMSRGGGDAGDYLQNRMAKKLSLKGKGGKFVPLPARRHDSIESGSFTCRRIPSS